MIVNNELHTKLYDEVMQKAKTSSKMGQGETQMLFRLSSVVFYALQELLIWRRTQHYLELIQELNRWVYCGQ